MIVSWIGYCLLISGCLFVAAFAAERALDHYGKPVRGVWLGSIIASVGVPALALAAPQFFRAASPVLSADARPVATLPELGVTGSLVSSLVEPAAMATIGTALLVAWVAGTVGLGLYLGVSYRRLRREMTAWTPGQILDAPVLLSSDRGPAVVGIRKSIIVMPEWITELEDRVLRLVFIHEKEHQRAGDHRLYALGLALLVLMPWNVFLWAKLKRLRLAIEFDCDHRVVEAGVDRREYAEALLEVGSRVSSPLLAAAAFAERRPSVEKRLRKLTSPARSLRAPRAAIAGVLGLTAMIFACSSEPPLGVDAGADALVVATDASAQPTYIPFDTPPVLQNGELVRGALMDHYPRDLMNAGIGGRIEIWLYVNEAGQVTNRQIKTSSGHPLLDQAALDVGATMEFQPAEFEGEQTDVWVSQWVTFEVM